MKKHRLFIVVLVFTLLIFTAAVDAVVCGISPPQNTEIAYGEYFMLIAEINGSDCLSRQKFEWYSSVDGFIGEGIIIKLNNLSAGKHTIELRYSDDCGGSCQGYSQITIKEAALSIYLYSPENEGKYSAGDEIFFDCRVYGGVKPYRYRWMIDGGFVGEQKSFWKTVSPGQHRAELVVRDVNGKEDRDEVVFYVIGEPELSIRITSPLQYQTFREDIGYIDFSADVGGGKKPYSYKWVVGGRILAETKDFRLSDVRRYVNESYTKIVLEVTDSTGKTSSSQVYFRVESVCKINGVCDLGETRMNCPADCRSGSQDGFCDRITDGRCDLDCLRWEDVDCSCNRDGVCEVGLEDSVKCPLDCVPYSTDGVCDSFSDGICDPDCKSTDDPDCANRDWVNYFVVIIFIAIVFVVYKLIKKRGML